MEYPIRLKYDDLEEIVEGWEKHKPTDTRKRKKNLEKLGQQYEFTTEKEKRNTTIYVITKKKFVGCGVRRKKEEQEVQKKSVHRTYTEMVYTGEKQVEDINYLADLTEDDYKIHDYIISHFTVSCAYSYEQILEKMQQCPHNTQINWFKEYKYNTDSYQKQLAHIFRSLDLIEQTFTTYNEKVRVYKVNAKREEPLQIIDKRFKLKNFSKRQLDIGILMATIKEETDSLRIVKTMTEGGIVVYIKATDLFEDVGLVNESFKENREVADYLDDYLPKEEQSLVYSHIQQKAKNSVVSALNRLQRGGAISNYIYTYIMVTTDKKQIGLNHEESIIVDKALELTVQDMVEQFPQLKDKCTRGADFYKSYDDDDIEEFKWEKLREHMREHFPNYRSHMRAFSVGLVDTKVERYLNKRAKEEDMDLTEFIEQQHGFTHVESTDVMTRKYWGTTEKKRKEKALIVSCTGEKELDYIHGYPLKDRKQLIRRIKALENLLSDGYRLTDEKREEYQRELTDLVFELESEKEKYLEQTTIKERLDENKLKEIEEFLDELED